MPSNNPEYMREYMKRYWATHPEYRAKHNENMRKWRKDHPGYAHDAYLLRKRRLLHGQTEA